MGNLHWLILIPYYFFGAMAVLTLLCVLTRVTRIKTSINTLVGIAIASSAFDLVFLLGTGMLQIDDFTGAPMAALGVVSFVLATVDFILQKSLPLPLDEELAAAHE